MAGRKPGHPFDVAFGKLELGALPAIGNRSELAGTGRLASAR